MSLPSVAHCDSRDPDTARALPVDLDPLAGLLAAVLAAEGVPARAEASLQLVDPDTIAALNAEHLGGDGPTDVLSFPIDGIDGVADVADAGHWMVGDVVVCAEVAASQAPDHAGTVQDELALLVVHGGLHLCGWDHADPAERAGMWARERVLMSELARPPARDPWGDR
jgi:probable rRNA maturation factor